MRGTDNRRSFVEYTYRARSEGPQVSVHPRGPELRLHCTIIPAPTSKINHLVLKTNKFQRHVVSQRLRAATSSEGTGRLQISKHPTPLVCCHGEHRLAHM